MRKRGWTILSLFLLLSIIGGYFLFAGEKEDPNLAPLKAKVKKLQEQNLSPQEMMAAYRQIRKKAEGLSDSARHELRQVGREGMRKMMNQRMDAYFNAPAEQQHVILDQQIREMEVMRRQMQAMRSQGGGPGGGRGEGMGQGGGRGEGMRPGGGGHGRWANATPEERNQRRKNRMERSDPKERSRMMEYISAMRDRRKQLGLPEMRHRGH